jgi:soluble lytic murein transglycosylase-like protein
LPELYRKHSVDRSETFLELMFAVMATESGFNRHAVSSADARGLLQLMPVAVREAMVRCNLRALKTQDELWPKT